MHKVASLNGEFVEALDAKIDAVSAALLYGRGVFTTVAIYDGEPFLLDKHLKRLRRDVEKLGLSKIMFGDIENSLTDLIQQNNIENGRARITLLDLAPGRIWGQERERETAVLMITGDFHESRTGLRLTMSPFPMNSRSPLAGVKSCNYLENLMALEEARGRGFDEAIRLNERGEIASACMANLFWESDGVLFASSLATGCSPGTTREFVMENLDCKEVAVGLDVLKEADSIYLCSAGLGVRQISSLDEKTFVNGDHELLHLVPPKHTKTRMSAS